MGKSSSPPPPDYSAAAKETASGNLEAARSATYANRINQVTPYGSLRYSQKPEEIIDYAAYNKALDQFNNQKNRPPADSRGVFSGFGSINKLEPLPALVRPELNDFKRINPDTGWTQTLELAPEAQQALDVQMALNRKYGETANVGFDRARKIFENPELDMSGLPQRAIDVGQTAQQAIMSRLSPQMSQQEDQLRTRLANQGITLGSEAYGREMAQQSQRANDLQMQAALQGINLDQANRASALQEQAYMQDRPLNLINALRSGNQVNAPQFQGFAQQATTQGADMLGATGMQYKADMDYANAENAQQSALMSGLFGVGGAALGGMMAGPGGGMAGAKLGAQIGAGAGASFSDIRLKTNIKRIGTHPAGVGLYEFDYIWGGGKQVGVMAQELELVRPDAVFEVDGFKAVDYGRI
jgi:hypothetical protein